jgi:hypothetical protein
LTNAFKPAEDMIVADVLGLLVVGPYLGKLLNRFMDTRCLHLRIDCYILECVTAQSTYLEGMKFLLAVGESCLFLTNHAMTRRFKGRLLTSLALSFNLALNLDAIHI